jgi:hypothetical protein
VAPSAGSDGYSRARRGGFSRYPVARMFSAMVPVRLGKFTSRTVVFVRVPICERLGDSCIELLSCDSICAQALE